MKRISRTLISGILAVQIGCAHTPRDRFQNALDEARCEDALAHLPESHPSVRVVDGAQVVAGNVASYSATGVAYAADAVVTVAGGAALFLVLCAPLVVLIGATAGGQGGSYSAPPCFPADLSNLKAPTMGSDTFEATQNWRCPDLNGSSQSMRKVASCFASRGGPEDLMKAKQSLDGLEASRGYADCLSSDEKKSVRDELVLVEGRLGQAGR